MRKRSSLLRVGHQKLGACLRPSSTNRHTFPASSCSSSRLTFDSAVGDVCLDGIIQPLLVIVESLSETFLLVISLDAVSSTVVGLLVYVSLFFAGRNYLWSHFRLHLHSTLLRAQDSENAAAERYAKLHSSIRRHVDLHWFCPPVEHILLEGRLRQGIDHWEGIFRVRCVPRSFAVNL
ncbi:hypothetical protein C8J56DRAFT_287659 [Mycena floridula]|nr:hypothetical protein C8J56DRAFT_287659 [Mycena floridula]